MQSYDVAIIGAGAAGLMCAMTAGARGRRVVLIDHLDHAGAKILISGGGRCNFTNLDTRPERYFSENPHFCKSALARYRPADFIGLIEKHRIAYHEKKLGQLFCDGSAKAVVAMLLDECAAAGVTLRLGTSVAAASRAGRFRLETSAGPIEAEALVLATGGLSIPKMGATDFSHRLARQFGLKTVPTRPALVPLTFGGEDLAAMQALSGVSVDCTAATATCRFRESLLFTHRGLSGPAILQASSAWTPEGQRAGEPLRLDLLPEQDATAFLLERKRSRPKAQLATVLEEILPQRLARQLAREFAGEFDTAARGMADLPDKPLRGLGRRLNDWRPVPTGTEGYAKAEATRGGIDTRGLSSRTMKAAAVPGLYAIGEAVDVVGWLGGYNFQWAWASGFCAGAAIAARPS